MAEGRKDEGWMRRRFAGDGEAVPGGGGRRRNGEDGERWRWCSLVFACAVSRRHGTPLRDSVTARDHRCLLFWPACVQRPPARVLACGIDRDMAVHATALRAFSSYGCRAARRIRLLAEVLIIYLFYVLLTERWYD